MKKIVLLLALNVYGLAHAQTGEYKKIFEQKPFISELEFYATLQAFQKENTEFASVYFQLGEIESQLFNGLDPIIDRRSSRQFIQNAKTNYGLCKNFFDLKEAMKNPEWYNQQKVKDKDSLQNLINSEVDVKYEAILEHATNYETLLVNYDKAVDKYLSARQRFIAINTSSDNLRELFLKASDSLKTQVKLVGDDFDSALYYLDKYRATYQKLPHDKIRKVRVVFQNIDHFRMNGITPSNFLADEIEVWNYEKWSRDFTQLLEEEVDGLRREIEEAFTYFTAVDKRMMEGDECLQVNLDDLKLQRIINLITKYDNQSILIDVFYYFRFKLAFGNQYVYERNCNIIENLPNDDIISRKARAYQNIYASLRVADSTANLTVSSRKNQTNFGWFYDEYMEEGAKRFTEEQILENKTAFREELDKYYDLVALNEMTADTMSLLFQRQDSLLLANPVSVTEDTLRIDQTLNLIDSTAILYAKSTETLYGCASYEGDYVIDWEMPIRDSLTYFKVLDDTSFLVGEGENITHFFASGKKKVSFQPKRGHLTNNVLFNNLSATYTTVSQNERIDTVFTLTEIDFNGKTTKEQNFLTNGPYLNHFINDQKIWVFTAVEGITGTILRAYTFDMEYHPMYSIDYTLAFDLEDILVTKNDNETISVIGEDREGEAYIYSLIDYEGNVKQESRY